MAKLSWTTLDKSPGTPATPVTQAAPAGVETTKALAADAVKEPAIAPPVEAAPVAPPVTAPATAEPTPVPAAVNPVAAPATAPPAAAPVAAQTATAPVIDIVATATPVPSVTVESVNTVAAAHAPTAPAPASLPAVVPKTQNAVAGPIDANWIKDDDNISLADIILPRINITQAVGELSASFDPGTVILNKSVAIGNDESPFTIAIVGFRPLQYVERVVGSSEMGNIFDTPAQVEEAGGTTDYDENKETGKPLYQKMATALVILERPEGCQDEDNFPYEVDGKKYALALWSMKGTAFTHGAKQFFTARRFGVLRQGYISKFYAITTKRKPFGKNFAHVPVLKPGEATPPGLRELAQTILG